MRPLRSAALVSSLCFVLACSGGITQSDGGVANTPTCDAGSLSVQVTAPQCLWAPNHKMVLFTLDDVKVTATGNCTVPTVTIIGVSSNQADLGCGQGNFTPDYTFNASAVCLRSEREGAASGPRIYTITFQVTDGSLTVTQSVDVTVDPNQSGTKCPLVDPSRIVPDGDPQCAPS